MNLNYKNVLRMAEKIGKHPLEVLYLLNKTGLFDEEELKTIEGYLHTFRDKHPWNMCGDYVEILFKNLRKRFAGVTDPVPVTEGKPWTSLPKEISSIDEIYKLAFQILGSCNREGRFSIHENCEQVSALDNAYYNQEIINIDLCGRKIKAYIMGRTLEFKGKDNVVTYDFRETQSELITDVNAEGEFNMMVEEQYKIEIETLVKEKETLLKENGKLRTKLGVLAVDNCESVIESAKRVENKNEVILQRMDELNRELAQCKQDLEQAHKDNGILMKDNREAWESASKAKGGNNYLQCELDQSKKERNKLGERNKYLESVTEDMQKDLKYSNMELDLFKDACDTSVFNHAKMGELIKRRKEDLIYADNPIPPEHKTEVNYSNDNEETPIHKQTELEKLTAELDSVNFSIKSNKEEISNLRKKRRANRTQTIKLNRANGANGKRMKELEKLIEQEEKKQTVINGPEFEIETEEINQDMPGVMPHTIQCIPDTKIRRASFTGTKEMLVDLDIELTLQMLEDIKEMFSHNVPVNFRYNSDNYKINVRVYPTYKNEDEIEGIKQDGYLSDELKRISKLETYEDKFKELANLMAMLLSMTDLKYRTK